MKQCSSCRRVYPDSAMTCSEDNSSLEPIPELAPGTILRGKYRIVSLIGAGGMAKVYRATNLTFNDDCAIKIVNDRYSGDASLSQRFRTEAMVMRKLRHPNAATIEDLDVMDDGRPFMVMEFVDGTSLRDAIQAQAPFAPPRAIRIAQQVGSALATAHRAGVIHRDIKPENIILVDRDGTETVKVLDFGVAKVHADLHGHDTTHTTSPGMIIGTPAYMAPEQADSKVGIPIDGRADLYSLAIVLYEMLSGKLPFTSDTPMGMLFHQVKSQPCELSGAMPSLAKYPELCDLISKCLRKDPRERYMRAEDLLVDLSLAAMAVAEARADMPSAEYLRSSRSNYETLDFHTPTPELEFVKHNTPDPKLEIAHVMFVDIVGYSQLPMSVQASAMQDLQHVVSSSKEYLNAQKDDLIALPVGGGLVLSFFGNPEAPIRCALYVAAELQKHPELQVRIGLHSGPVYRVRDITDNINIAGGGFNFAQRVMACGDAGHILASGTIVDLLTQHSSWSSYLHELGVAEVKHGVKLRVFNVYTDEAGNPAVPLKLKTGARVVAANDSAAPQLGVLTPPPEPGSRTSDIALSPENVEHATKDLALYIGPIARVIVKRASRNCSTLKELYHAVAKEIESPKERERFLNSRPRH